MNLAKQHLDIGLFSTKRDEQLAFWQQTVGLPYDHLGKLGGGMQQHRHHMNGSILKMNHSRNPLPEAPPSGIIGLQIAREGLATAQSLSDPGARLTGELRSFGVESGTNQAVVIYDAALVREGNVVEKRRFEARVPVSEIAADSVGIGINQAANQVAGEVADWVGH